MATTPERVAVPAREQELSPEQKIKWLKQLAGEQGLFIKRSPKSGGVLDRGWIPGAISVTRTGEESVIATKPVEGEDEDESLKRNIPMGEVARLNTGKNRKALEYLFPLQGSDDRIDRLIAAVDTSDADPKSREELRAFFEQEALRFGKEQLASYIAFKKKEAPVVLNTIDDLERLLQDQRAFSLELNEQVEGMASAELREALDQLAGLRKKGQEPSADLIEDIAELERNIDKSIRGQREAKRKWDSDTKHLRGLIDLARQFSK